jgi:type VI secretion system secreted protein Hcp
MRIQHRRSRASARLAAVVVTSAALVGVMPGAANADSAFLRLDAIPGESTARGFERQIDVSAFGWSATNPAAPGGGGGGVGRVSFQELSVTKAVDAASPPLFAAVAAGRHVRDAVLTVVTAGERPEAYLRYCLRDVTVASLKQEASRAERPVETVTFRYGQFAIAYGQQAADGSRTFVTQGWDLIRNLATLEAC